MIVASVMLNFIMEKLLYFAVSMKSMDLSYFLKFHKRFQEVAGGNMPLVLDYNIQSGEIAAVKRIVTDKSEIRNQR
ncbi:hypothetical protein BB560_006007, partial [Smittium megazygosporum]